MSRFESTRSEFEKRLKSCVDVVNSRLSELMDKRAGIHGRLRAAIVHALYAPGKRVRGALVLWCCELICGKMNEDARSSAAAVEMIHTYSLIHDDLPAMDDDDFRRGRPTCHKQFDEATAILAGDALLTLGFEILSSEVSRPEVAVMLILELAKAAGPEGMIAGQMGDLAAENSEGSQRLLESIHTNKTAKMFQCAAAMGAISGGANEKQLEGLRQYGLKLGLGFQVCDDILDVCGDSGHMGKTVGKDEKARKLTYPGLLGVGKAKVLEKRLAKEAVDELESFGASAGVLRELAAALVERSR